MNNFPFVGRETEIKSLQQLTGKKTASLVVITGRRRVGKSRLAEEFAREYKFYEFTGLPPTKKITAQAQRDEFAIQLSQQTNLPEVKADDWSKLFFLLAEKVKSEHAVILFDEISWMGQKDPTFLAKLKNAWDLHLKKNSKLILILCGSISSWIEKNIISSTGFFGRISLKIILEELPLPDCNKLFEYIGFKRSITEKLMLLAVTGGIPWYIEQINSHYSAEDNIKNLCFTKNGLLVDEFRNIFHDLFNRRGEICQKIVEFLAKGSAEYNQIIKALNYHSSGSLSEYLKDLLVSGFIKREFTWSLRTGKESELSRYRLSDNYLRFYLKYMMSRIDRIKRGQFSELSLASLPGWNTMLGLQFEHLVLNNRRFIMHALEIKSEDVINDNPFFQRKTMKQKGCQIDYLIQTKYNTLFICEIKFSRNEIKSTVIDEVKTKISNLSLPRGFSCVPVLIHVGGVSDEVEEKEYFSKIIDFSRLLEDAK